MELEKCVEVCNELVQGIVCWWVFVKTVMNLWVL